MVQAGANVILLAHDQGPFKNYAWLEEDQSRLTLEFIQAIDHETE